MKAIVFSFQWSAANTTDGRFKAFGLWRVPAGNFDFGGQAW
jgi:hypothetical protein